MTTIERPDAKSGPAAGVDYLVDENGQRVPLPAEQMTKAETEVPEPIGATGPTNWWRYGLAALAAIVVVIGLMQVFGRAPGTDVQPGSPTAEPVTATDMPAQ